MNILAFGASNSKNSINAQLAKWTAHQISDATVDFLDLNDYEVDIYSIDRELDKGIPTKIMELVQKIDTSDGLVISFAEHNGAYSTAFKNLFDWLSRVPERSTWNDTKMFLLATSPGARGGSSVLEMAVSRFPYNGGNVVASFSLPSFHENFNPEQGITNPTLLQEFQQQLDRFISA